MLFVHQDNLFFLDRKKILISIIIYSFCITTGSLIALLPFLLDVNFSFFSLALEKGSTLTATTALHTNNTRKIYDLNFFFN